MYEIVSGESQTFEFSVDGEKYAVPTFDALPYSMLREFRDYAKGDVSGTDISLWAIDNIFERFAPGCTERLTIGQLYGLVDAYVKVETLGE